PSTHIVKPPSRQHPEIEALEVQSLRLADDVGIAASQAEVVRFKGQPAFVTKRWDRRDGQRVHAEDLNQALGRPTSAKYSTTAVRALRLLSAHGLERDFLRQLAFNVALGNADAHAKNYSILLEPDKMSLAPVY